VIAHDDGGITYETVYADARPLLSWLLGLADAAELLEPAGLREQLLAQLRRLDALLDEPLPAASARPTAATARPPADAGGDARPTTGAWRLTASRVWRRSPRTCCRAAPTTKRCSR